MMDQANEKKIEAINALSEGDKLFFSTYSRTLGSVLLLKKGNEYLGTFWMLSRKRKLTSCCIPKTIYNVETSLSAVFPMQL